MIDPSHPAASWFLWLLAAAFSVVFALPLLLAPLSWARVFRWSLPAETHLTVYFGRCLGAVAVGLVAACLRAAPSPATNLVLFDVLIVSGALLTAVHVWGAITNAQPWTETAEIALYGGLTAAAVWLRSTLA